MAEYNPIDILPFSISEITDNTIDGAGVLDVLLTTMNLHLAKQYDTNRITGTEYAQAFIELYSAHLNAAINYSVQRSKLGYELKNLELQGINLGMAADQITAEIERSKAETEQVKYITTSQLPIQVANLTKEGQLLDKQVTTAELNNTTRIPAEVNQIKAQTTLTTAQKDNVVEETTLIPHRITQLTAQTAQVTAETSLTNKNTDRVAAEITKIPVEIEVLQKQLLKEDANTALIQKQIDTATLNLTLIPKQVELTTAQISKTMSDKDQVEAATARIIKETTERLPVEIANLVKSGTGIDAEIALSTARTNEVTESLKKIPAEVSYLQAQTSAKVKEVLILEKNLELKEGELDLQQQQIDLNVAELSIKAQQIEVAKAQVTSNKAQADLYTAKVTTEMAQTKGNVAEPGSVIYLNNQVLQGQYDGYKNDAKQKAAKLILDAWMIGAQNEVRDANNTNKLDDSNLGTAMTEVFKGAGFITG